MSSSPSIEKLLASGATIEPSPGGGRLSVARLSFETAVTLGHAMTVQLDVRHGDRAMYRPDSYTAARALQESRARLERGETTIFGETRPDERNMAVRVDRHAAAFGLVADIRNAYEDRPELQGGLLLQMGFVAAIETIDL